MLSKALIIFLFRSLSFSLALYIAHAYKMYRVTCTLVIVLMWELQYFIPCCLCVVFVCLCHQAAGV